MMKALLLKVMIIEIHKTVTIGGKSKFILMLAQNTHKNHFLCSHRKFI